MRTKYRSYCFYYFPFLTNQPDIIKFNNENKAFIHIKNCAPFDITISSIKKIGFLENFNNKEEILELNSDLLNKILTATENEYEHKEKLTFLRRKSRIYK